MLGIPKASAYSPVLWGMIILTAIVGASASGYVYFLISDALSQGVVDRARVAASTIDPYLVAQLRGDESDVLQPGYAALKQQLMDIRSATSDTRFVYVMAIKDNAAVFLADSEPPHSADYSPPGQVYHEASDVLFDALRLGISGYEIERDRWGRWLSGLAPIVNPGDGKIVAVLGMDVDAGDEFLPAVVTYSALPLVTAVAVGSVLTAAYLLSRREEERLHERGQNLSIASHEVRTPLTGILWASEAIIGAAPPPEIRSRAIAIHQSALSVIESVNNLLTMHVMDRKDALALQAVRVEELAAEVTKAFSLSASARQIAFQFDFGAHAADEWRADREKARLMLSNVVSNAVKYADQKTTVTITYRPAGRFGELRVSNSGKGIAPEDLPKIFDGYHRGSAAAQQAEGSGLGLALVRRIAQAHGGSVDVLSSEVTGVTEFMISIPRANDHATA